MRRILVATDGSETARAAVGVGAELAAEHGAELVLAHVVPAVDVVATAGLVSSAFPHEPSDAERAVLEDAADEAAEHGCVATTALLRGHTVHELVAYADSHDADLIVVGSRGHGAVASALLGSVSRGLLREAGRPVLIVPAQSAAWTAARRPGTAVGLGF
jgi:nucleotide-binding universal stress UspA family protein